MNLKIGLNLFVKEAMLFIIALSVGLFFAFRLSKLSSLGQFVIEPISFKPTDLIFLFLFVVFLFLIIKFKKIGGIFLKIFLSMIVFSGSLLIFDTLMVPIFSISLSIILLILFLKIKNVIIHNIAIILGIAGAGTILGLSLDPLSVVIILVLFSIYDIIAVYKTKHMVSLAKGMIEGGAIFGFIIPFNFSGFLNSSKDVGSRIGQDFMILGSGDIGLPIVFAASVVQSSLWSAIVVAAFSVIGLFLTHLIFINQKERSPMAALPPIATMAIIGYLLSILIKI